MHVNTTTCGVYMHSHPPLLLPIAYVATPVPPVVAKSGRIETGEGHGAPNLRSGLPHSPPEAEDGLGESEEEVEPLSASTAAAAATSTDPVAAMAACPTQLVHPSPVL